MYFGRCRHCLRRMKYDLAGSGLCRDCLDGKKTKAVVESRDNKPEAREGDTDAFLRSRGWLLSVHGGYYQQADYSWLWL